MWARTRRRGRTVALIGGDGSGKSSIAHRLVCDSTLDFEYFYMGPSLTSASHLLPTSRFVIAIIDRDRGADDGVPDRDSLESRERPSSFARFSARSLLQLSEVAHREIRVRLCLRRGVHAVFDRHILFEIWPLPRPEGLGARARNTYARLLRSVSRRPDLTVLLLADPAVMVERKGETNLAYLSRRNREWVEMARTDPSIVVIDANRDLDTVYGDVIDELRAAGITGSTAR